MHPTSLRKPICKAEEPEDIVFWFFQYFVYHQLSGMEYIPGIFKKGILKTVIFKKLNRTNEINKCST